MEHTTDCSVIYQTFKSYPGSDYISSEYALNELAAWVRKIQPARVLEVGAGIGTMTFLLASLRREIPFSFISVEWNQFCLDAAKMHLHSQQGDFVQVRTAAELDGFGPFNLIVIDGGEQDDQFISSLAGRGVIFIEGFMDKKHTLIESYYAGKRKFVKANFRSRDRKKGVWIYQFEPTPHERASFALRNFFNRLYSAIRRRGRGLLKNGIGEARPVRSDHK